MTLVGEPVAARPVSRGRAIATQPAGAWIVAALTTAAYILFSFTQWIRLESPSWDLGIFTQLAKDYASFQAPIVPIKGDGFNLLGDHFHPLLVVLGPVYALFPSAFTLLVVQDVLIGVSAFVVARASIRMLGTPSGVCLGLAYGLSWGLQNAAAAQFHEIAFALPLLALSLEAVLWRRWTAAALWAAPLVFVKEDLGVTVAAIGAYAAWKGGSRIGAWLAVWGLGWVLLAVLVILPLLNPGSAYAYGLARPGEWADPWSALIALFTPEQKYQTLALMLLCTGALALRSPLVLLVVPTLAWRFVSTNQHYWGPGWHYSAVLMPILFMALLDAIRSTRASARSWLRSYGRAVVPVAGTVAAMLLPGLPLGSLATPSAYAAPARAGQAHEAMATIPDGSIVESDIALMHYLVPRTTVYWLGNPGNPPPDYLILDRSNGTWGGSPPDDVAAYAEERHPGARYELVYDEAGYQVARRE